MNKKILKTFGWALICFLLLSIVTSMPANSQDIRWQSFEEALDAADSTNQSIVVDVWAPWCGWCLKMKQEVYPALDSKLAERFVFTRLNRDDNETYLLFSGQTFTPLRLAQNFGVHQVPALVILNSDGDYLLHISGFVSAGKLQKVLTHILR